MGIETNMELVCEGREHDRLSQACEDVTAQDLRLPVDCPAALLAVFDGHGGRSAAEQASTLLPDQLRKLMPRMHHEMATGEVSGPAICGGTVVLRQWGF
jgi:serine/threonine protein phosphatase PrpC